VAEWDEEAIDQLFMPGGDSSTPIWRRTKGEYRITPVQLREFAARLCEYGYTVVLIPEPIYRPFN
jgi:hypothetical protein